MAPGAPDRSGSQGHLLRHFGGLNTSLGLSHTAEQRPTGPLRRGTHVRPSAPSCSLGGHSQPASANPVGTPAPELLPSRHCQHDPVSTESPRGNCSARDRLSAQNRPPWRSGRLPTAGGAPSPRCVQGAGPVPRVSVGTCRQTHSHPLLGAQASRAGTLALPVPSEGLWRRPQGQKRRLWMSPFTEKPPLPGGTLGRGLALTRRWCPAQS